MKRSRLLGVAIATATLVPGLTLGLLSGPSAVAAPVAAVYTAPAPNDAGAVTIPLRPRPALVSAVPVPTRWTVKPGESLSVIAGKAYGSKALWPALWWVNKARVHNPNMVAAGQVLKLSSWHPHLAWLDRAAVHAIPAPPPPPRAMVLTSASRTYRGSAVSSSSTRHYRSYASGSYHGSGSMERCIISRESGGNSQVMNGSGHYGLYQFSASTWVASGGSASSFGHASVSEQQRVFHSAVAARGYSDWTPYDGC